ncbi:MAG TPA: transposase [Candidatus Aquirickettsiella sp.]
MQQFNFPVDEWIADKGYGRGPVGKYCQRCLLRSECLPDNYSHRARFIYRGLYQDEIDRIKKRQQTLHFKKKLIERQWKIEGLFAEAKENHAYGVLSTVD